MVPPRLAQFVIRNCDWWILVFAELAKMEEIFTVRVAFVRKSPTVVGL
jgi:hypothetical protein